MNGRGDPPAITFRGVTKRYGSQVALEPTDLEIEESEFFCLLGPSGCGKTTTLNLVGGFIVVSIVVLSTLYGITVMFPNLIH